MAKLAELLGHLLEGGQVILDTDEGTDGAVPYHFAGSIKLQEVGNENTIQVLVSGANAPEYKAYYSPEQEEIRRLKAQLEASKEEIARLTSPKPRANYTRLEIGIYTDIRDYRENNPRMSVTSIAQACDCSYGFVQRILAGKHADLEQLYLKNKAVLEASKS